MPSDHVIQGTDRFRAAVRQAAAVATEGRIVLFGIRPTEPHTGYGYIRRGEPKDVHAVDAFVEKPDAEAAERYVAEGYL